jgi:hypothetical protein
MLVGEATIVDLESDGAPGTNRTVVVADAEVPPIANETTLSSSVVDDVKRAVYVPLPLFVTDESDPAVRNIVTVMPALFVIRLPFASNNVTVTVDMLVPSAAIVSGAETIVDVRGDAAPGTNVTVACPEAAAPFTANEIVLVCAVVEDVSVAL